ncbi:cytochrome c family protein [Trinickia violacea]|uniref:Cytochrome c family protein n=1 Tax=Trinickia violacea TaxID=2571746 RepID=A0A4P8IX86_9BURK|nr:cytochrome c family protein [Trinickia violacea]QCP53111.1 cytochrome c family protein [Trinickia violacea]
MKTSPTIFRRLTILAGAAHAAAAIAGPAAAQDVAAGNTAFAQCAACHSVDDTNGVGPSLKGVVGRQAGTFPGFRFSRAMKGFNKPWDEKILDAYLTNPQAAVPGNIMPFSGVTDAKERADIIAYLKTLK